MEIPFKASGLEHGTPARNRHWECRSSSRVCLETVGHICAIELVWPVLHRVSGVRHGLCLVHIRLFHPLSVRPIIFWWGNRGACQGTNVPRTGAKSLCAPRRPSRRSTPRCVPLQSTAVGYTSAAGFLAELKSGTVCSPPEHSAILTTHKGRQSHFFNLFLIFSIFCLWYITFLLPRSGNTTVPGSRYKGWVMEKFHHLSPDYVAMQDPCSIFLLSARNTYRYDYNMKTRILFYLKEWKGLQRVKII